MNQPFASPKINWIIAEGDNPQYFLAHQIGISVVFTHVSILSHIPVPALRKDKTQTAACWPQAGRTSIHDVVVMLK